MTYTIVGYHPQSDEEFKLDTFNRISMLKHAKQFEAAGLIDIQIFQNSDSQEETITYDFKNGKLV